jgi:multidrug resistance efflux pump
VTALHARPGQKVKSGEVLARFRIAPEHVLQLQRRVSPTQVKELDIHLAGVEKSLEQFRAKQSELRQLAQQNLATPESIAQVDREIQFLNKQRAAMQERLTLERGLVQEDLAALKKLLGEGVSPGHVPKEMPLVAPIAGHVVWVNPDFRENAELGAGAPALIVGVLNPMRVRTLVHEIEAVQLKPGDAAQFSTETLPGQRFEARVVSIPWVSATPAVDQPSYYEVELEVPNPEFLLKEGLRGQVLFPKAP